MSIHRALTGLMLLGLASAGATPVAAQNWPADSGPTGDLLGATARQFERLALPPVEAGAQGERPIPGLTAGDLPPASATARPALIPGDGPRPPVVRAAGRHRPARQASRRAPATDPVTRAEMRRELAERDGQIQDLRRQLEDARRGR